MRKEKGKQRDCYFPFVTSLGFKLLLIINSLYAIFNILPQNCPKKLQIDNKSYLCAMTNKELIAYFESGARPISLPVEISSGVWIKDYDKFMVTHLSNLKTLGENTAAPVALRLRWLKEAIEKGA